MSEEQRRASVRTLYKAYTNGGRHAGARGTCFARPYCAGVSFTPLLRRLVHAWPIRSAVNTACRTGWPMRSSCRIFLDAYGAACHKKLGRLARIAGRRVLQTLPDSEAAEAFIRWIRETNAKMGHSRNHSADPHRRYSGNGASCRQERATRSTPFPVLMDEGRLAQMYLKLMPAKGGKRMNTPFDRADRRAQRRFFASGQTLDLAFRKQSLLTLKRAIRAHEEAVNAALMQDLGKERSRKPTCVKRA